LGASVAETSETRHLPRHPIRVVARRTGLKADLIRAWERRYHAIEPERTSGRHRFYSDAEIERLRLLRQATGTGRSIGQIANLSDEQLRALVEEDRGESGSAQEENTAAREALARQVLVSDKVSVSERANDRASDRASERTAEDPERGNPSEAKPAFKPASRQLSPFLDAISRLDGRELRNHLDRAAVELGYSRVLTEIVEPLMRQVGDRWHAGALREMHEHLAAFEVRSFIEGLLRRVSVGPVAPRLVVTTPVGERHEIGALLAAATACFEGWDVVYLGCDLPAKDIAAAASTVHALAVALSISFPTQPAELGHELLELRRRLADQVALLIGGQAHQQLAAFLQPEPGFAPPLVVEDLAELRGVLAAVRARAKVAAEQVASALLQVTPNQAHDFLPSPWTPTPLPNIGRPLGHRELPLARAAFESFQLDATLLSENGSLRLGDLQNVRRLAQRLNLSPAVAENPQRSLRAGRLHALGLLHEVSAEILHHYRSTQNPGLLRRALAHLQKTLGEKEVAGTLERFAKLYPPTQEAWMGEAPEPTASQQPEDLLERLLLLWLVARNSAAASVRQLFDDRELSESSTYRRLMQRLETFLRAQPPCHDGKDLFTRLLEAQENHPESLRAQLEERLHLETDLPSTLVDRIWMAIDTLREEEAPPWNRDAPPPPPQVLRFAEAPAPRRSEAAWMRDLVLVAKNVKVWLEQLGKAQGQKITRLDEIPESELEGLANAGFTGLWLVGVWQRSKASQRIKELAGRKGVLASAYAIDRYEIAEDLGGQAALDRLEKKAWRHGLRLAGDIVPNHTALDAKWVIERPELFLSVREKPFPSYTFLGEDLSQDPRVGIYLEDHYFDQSDAAVVFQRVDRKSGEKRYLYHGNDGTSLPWNDTAQLDYAQPEVRQLMIETIVAAAKSFPVLRLDAAMTLVKEHFQRLWYPAPGKGGAIPSRAEYGLSPEAFDRRMPKELWREVVERLETEAPDTLLIAEGFWYLEDFFIQQLGMHRVYNSAFFHLLRDQNNAKLRANWKAVLAHDPAILQRFCNFLTNPDEKSAVETLGKGDRYFALCTLLATLPGLPLFGHGQQEAFIERYAMDLPAPEFSEAPDAEFVKRHEREIVPLLKNRHLFAGTENFRLYDFLEELPGGEVKVNEDVFAFSNGVGKERKLVLVHNQNTAIKGHLGASVPFRDLEAGKTRSEAPEEALGRKAGVFELGPWDYRVV